MEYVSFKSGTDPIGDSRNSYGTAGAKKERNMLSLASSSHIVGSSVSTLVQTLGACAFGALVLFAVGFMPMAAAHNAAHDTRHTVVFPCH
jgi:cobalt transporter subunit CbtB